jgi:fused signal recognition particle receptor
MFKKLKNKLKDALTSFSKKAEGEAEVISEEVVEEPVKEKSVPEEKLVAEKIIEKPVVEKKKEVVEDKPAVCVPKKEEVVVEKKEVKEPTEEELERMDDLIEKGHQKKSEKVPMKFDAGQMQHVPDLENIEEPVEKEVIEEKAEIIEEAIQRPKKRFGLFKKKEKPVVEKETVSKEEPKKKGLGKLTEKLTTKKISAEKFEKIFWDLELVLLENNVSVQVIDKIKENLKEELVDKPLPRNVSAKILEVLKRTLDEILTFDKLDLIALAKDKKPLIIAVFGINGAGKTTSIAKLTKYFQNNGLSVVLAACDTFRAAAIQQLEEHANNLKVKMIKHDYGSDAAAVAFDAKKYAEKNGVDVVLIDTAGRLHSNANLMAELEKIIRITEPDVKLFVGESITGNDCVEQAEKFNSLVEMDGAILTKADVDEKGGAPLSISYVIKKPILFLGVGQEYKDLEEFDKDKVLERLGL